MNLLYFQFHKFFFLLAHASKLGFYNPGSGRIVSIVAFDETANFCRMHAACELVTLPVL